jgi:hypothetical protein
MILQIDPPFPVFSVPHQEEGYAHFLLEYGIESYFYFVVALEKTGELWILSNREVRATKNFNAERPSINTQPYSVYLKHGSPIITPYTPTPNKPDD